MQFAVSNLEFFPELYSLREMKKISICDDVFSLRSSHSNDYESVIFIFFFLGHITSQ